MAGRRGCERGLGEAAAGKIPTQRWFSRATNASGLRRKQYAFYAVFLALMGAADASLIRPVLDFRPTERWPSGRRRTPGKCVYGNVSRVRIPPSPPIQQKGLKESLFYCFGEGFAENRLTRPNANQGSFAFERYCWRPSRGESRFGAIKGYLSFHADLSSRS